MSEPDYTVVDLSLVEAPLAIPLCKPCADTVMKLIRDPEQIRKSLQVGQLNKYMLVFSFGMVFGMGFLVGIISILVFGGK